jgi:hypothetical protein
MAEKKCPATVRVYFDNVNSESYQTFLAYCDRLEYKYDVPAALVPAPTAHISPPL